MHIKIVIDSHNKNARVSDISPLKTSATDGKVIEIAGSKKGRNNAIMTGLAISPHPTGTLTVNHGNSSETSHTSQITQNTSPITEYHNHGVIDWGFNINDINS